MADAAAVTEALVARLAGDATLMGLLPDGVYVNVAPQGTTRLAFVSLESVETETQMGPPGARRATEEFIYAVKAVVLDSSRATAGDAAARIDALLEDQPLTITGYGCLSVAREESAEGVIDETEVDEIDNSIRWQHRGARYRVLVTPTATT